MGECHYCGINGTIIWGRYQCSDCIPEIDMCQYHYDYHIQTYPEHHITDKQMFLHLSNGVKNLRIIK